MHCNQLYELAIQAKQNKSNTGGGKGKEFNISGKKLARQTYAWRWKTPRLILHLHLAENPGKGVPRMKIDKQTNQPADHASTGWHKTNSRHVLQLYETTTDTQETISHSLRQPTVVIRRELLRCAVRLILKLYFAIDPRKMSVPSSTKFLPMLKLSWLCLSTKYSMPIKMYT